MFRKVGMSSRELEEVRSTDTVEWMREICWQLAKLREEIDRSRPRITRIDNGHPKGDPMNDPPSLR